MISIKAIFINKKYFLLTFLVNQICIFGDKLSDIKKSYGGSVWESNPPCPFVTGNTGFEVQEGHQNPMHSRMIQYIYNNKTHTVEE
jgi:hypothetical protein